MRAFLVRDKDGCFKCFHTGIPVRHHVTGRWESKPKSAKSYLVVSPDDIAKEYRNLTWLDEPKTVVIKITKI